MTVEGAGAPLGAVAVDTSSSNSGTSNPNPSTTQNTQVSSQQVSTDPVEINPDGLYKIPGVDKPVKFSDHVRGFQAQATKASQRAAELERKLQEAERKAQQFEAQQRYQGNGQPQQGPDAFAEMAAKPYLSGEELAGAFSSVAAEINARDRITIAILNKLKQLESTLKPVYETTQSQAWQGKIGNWLSQGNYGEEWRTVAEGLYLEYEPGPELDEAFPQLLQQRIQQIEANFEKRRKAAAEAARRAPFVPGKGGQASPSKPFQPNPRNSAREDVDALWDSIQVGPGT